MNVCVFFFKFLSSSFNPVLFSLIKVYFFFWDNVNIIKHDFYFGLSFICIHAAVCEFGQFVPQWQVETKEVSQHRSHSLFRSVNNTSGRDRLMENLIC